MGAKKKLAQKVKVFYKGPEVKPAKIADEHEMKTVVTALKDAIPEKDAAFETSWKGTKMTLKLIVGLSATIRCLRHKRSLAIIFDDTASAHLSVFLREFARKAEVPILQAHRLIDIAPEVSLKTLLVVSIAKVVTGREEIYRKPSRPQPKAIEKFLVSETFNELCHLLESIECDKGDNKDVPEYRQPILEKVVMSGTKNKKLREKKQKVKSKQLKNV